MRKILPTIICVLVAAAAIGNDCPNGDTLPAKCPNNHSNWQYTHSKTTCASGPCTIDGCICCVYTTNFYTCGTCGATADSDTYVGTSAVSAHCSNAKGMCLQNVVVNPRDP